MALKYCRALCLVLHLTAMYVTVKAAADYDMEYNYGDPSFVYDHDLGDGPRFETTAKVQMLLSSDAQRSHDSLPLCCPRGEVYDMDTCVKPQHNYGWKPHLDGASNAVLEYSGFPKCEMKQTYIHTYQRDVIFAEQTALLPPHIRMSSLDRKEYCITKVQDLEDPLCGTFAAQIISCFAERRPPKAVFWSAVGISHLMLAVTVVAFLILPELRCLQGQYIICFLVSLLIYNIGTMPGSILPMTINTVSCIALGAVKYFFFCGTFLWFNVICFDVWRTFRTQQDLSGRRRFICYSAYAWILSALLTCTVLVLPFVFTGADPNSPAAVAATGDTLRDPDYESCKLKVQINMILQIAQFVALIFSVLFLAMATCGVCSYNKFGRGLPRCEASLCLKQAWKLFIIMLAHLISCVDSDLVHFPVELWLFILLECASVFGVLAYRRTLVRLLRARRWRTRPATTVSDDINLGTDEKGQLTQLA